MKINDLYSDKNGFSWRKTLTLLAALLFVIACIIYWIWRIALPTEYMTIIAAVFSFYFFRAKMSGESQQYQPYGQDKNPYGNYQPPLQYPQNQQGQEGA